MRTTTATAHVSAIPSLNPIPLQNPNPDAELNEAADHLTSAISHMVSDLNAGKSLDSIFLIYPTAFASEYATATASASASADPAPAPASRSRCRCRRCYCCCYSLLLLLLFYDAREWWSALHQHVDFVVAPLLEPPTKTKNTIPAPNGMFSLCAYPCSFLVCVLSLGLASISRTGKGQSGGSADGQQLPAAGSLHHATG